jgi:hypothetical protein
MRFATTRPRLGKSFSMKQICLAVAAALLLLASVGDSRAEDATLPAPPPRIIFSTAAPTPQAFEEFARQAKALGATDIDVSDLPRDRWQWFDPADPYPNWSLLEPGILKIMAPAALQPDVPTDNALRCQQILAQRGAVLRKLGLMAALHGAEPMWLPEGVYLRHPIWRGPRVQSPIRSRHDYFAPCVDQPQVLALYRQATADLCRIVPIDSFAFLVNDSGSGLCWHPGLYPGPNGPAFCKDRPMAERIDGFLDTLRAGARDAGIDATVRITGSGQKPVPADRPLVSAGNEPGPWESIFYPVIDIPDPIALSQQLEQISATPGADRILKLPAPTEQEYFDLIRAFGSSPIVGPAARMQAINAAAANIVGTTDAPRLTQAWLDIHDSAELLRNIDNGGPVLLLGCVNQRWLVRPLVPFPMELEPGEKEYFRKFQFQAATEQDAANLMNCQGLFIISGDAGTALASALFNRIIKHLQAADRQLSAMTNSAGADAVKALDLRINALILVVRNADITARYQAFLDRFRPEWSSRPDRAGYPEPELGIKIVDEDIANTTALLELIRSTQIPLLTTASRAEDEDVFTFGPELTQELEKKIAIEQRYEPVHQRLLHP